jgi:hypothetical protein
MRVQGARAAKGLEVPSGNLRLLPGAGQYPLPGDPALCGARPALIREYAQKNRGLIRCCFCGSTEGLARVIVGTVGPVKKRAEPERPCESRHAREVRWRLQIEGPRSLNSEVVGFDLAIAVVGKASSLPVAALFGPVLPGLGSRRIFTLHGTCRSSFSRLSLWPETAPEEPNLYSCRSAANFGIFSHALAV